MKLTTFDAAQHLKTNQEMAVYLDEMLSENDPAMITHALGVIARDICLSSSVSAREIVDYHFFYSHARHIKHNFYSNSLLAMLYAMAHKYYITKEIF